MLELNKITYKLDIFNNDYILKMSLNGESCEIRKKFDDSNKSNNIKNLISKNIWYFAVKNYSKSKHLYQKELAQGMTFFRETKLLNYLEIKSIVIQSHLTKCNYFELSLDKSIFDYYLNLENIISMNKRNIHSIDEFFDFEIIENENPEFYI